MVLQGGLRNTTWLDRIEGPIWKRAVGTVYNSKLAILPILKTLQQLNGRSQTQTADYKIGGGISAKLYFGVTSQATANLVINSSIQHSRDFNIQ